MSLIRYKPFAVLGVVIIILLILTIYFQQMKREELQNELSKVELQDVRIGAGTSKGKLGTAIFGIISNNGERAIKIATMSVESVVVITAHVQMTVVYQMVVIQVLYHLLLKAIVMTDNVVII